MTRYFYNDQNISAADNVTLKALAESDSIIFAASAVWAATGMNSVALLLRDDNDVTVYGQLYGDTAIGESVSGGIVNSILVGATGIVAGVSYGIDQALLGASISNYGMISGNTAIDAGSSPEIMNAGVIAGKQTGIVARDASFGTEIENSGTISGGTAIVFGGGTGAVVENSGQIFGTSTAISASDLQYGMSIDNTGTIFGSIDLYIDSVITIDNAGTITGRIELGSQNDVFDGSLGITYGPVSGRDGDDQLSGGDATDQFFGGAGTDILSGGTGDDRLSGGLGGDLVDGGAGFDFASYRDDQSVYIDLAAPDRNTGAGAGDSFTSIEGLIGSQYHGCQLYGDAGDNRLIGGPQADVLDGRAGNDVLRGGADGDSYCVDSRGDRVIEGVGGENDTVTSTISYTLPDNVEILFLDGRAAIAGHGNALDNHLTGNSAANVLDGGDGMDTIDGGKGTDTMTGGNGWDTYHVDNVGDVVIEVPGDSNSDTVHATISYTLPDNVEILFLDGARAINATGNAANDLIVGNAAANTLNGGLGNDQLSGGEGADHFVFSTALDATSNLDTVFDFVSGTDTLQLSRAIFTAITGNATLPASQFHVGTAAHDANDHVIYDDATGNLFYDPDGTGAQAQVEFATLSHALLQPVPILMPSDIQLVG